MGRGEGEQDLANIAGLRSKSQRKYVCERDWGRIESHIKCLMRLYKLWEVWEIRKFIKELIWMLKESKGKLQRTGCRN